MDGGRMDRKPLFYIRLLFGGPDAFDWMISKSEVIFKEEVSMKTLLIVLVISIMFLATCFVSTMERVW
jgi:hypothetical protein